MKEEEEAEKQQELKITEDYNKKIREADLNITKSKIEASGGSNIQISEYLSQ